MGSKPPDAARLGFSLDIVYWIRVFSRTCLPLDNFSEQAPKRACTSFFSPALFLPLGCNHSRFLCVTTPLTIEVVSCGTYWVSTAGLPSNVSRRPFVHSEFLMRDTLITVHEHPFTSLSFITPIPPPSALYPVTYFYSLSSLATLSPPYFFDVSSVHWFSSLFLRLVLYVLISDSTTLFGAALHFKDETRVKKTIREKAKRVNVRTGI
jgi:hypothetical protein